MNSLVLKIPKDKPPYIGIRYSDSFQGEAANKEFFLKHLEHELHLVLEVLPQGLNVKLICNETLQIHTFTRVAFEPEKLKNWLFIGRGAKHFNFGCTTLVKDTEKVIKVLNTKSYNLVLKLNKVQILEQGVESFNDF